MKTYTKEELGEILGLHRKWLADKKSGVRADLSYADLSSANLSFADLSSANLRYADLSYANLRFADLRSTDLRSTDLRSADLHSADLRFADLRSAIGEMKYIKSLQCEKYHISYTATKLNIGCQSHTISEWQNFDDKIISEMDEGALDWWKKWKPILMNIIEVSPALESEVEK